MALHAASDWGQIVSRLLSVLFLQAYAVFIMPSCITKAYFTQASLSTIASKSGSGILRSHLFLGTPSGIKGRKADPFRTGLDPRADVGQDSEHHRATHTKHVFFCWSRSPKIVKCGHVDRRKGHAYSFENQWTGRVHRYTRSGLAASTGRLTIHDRTQKRRRSTPIQPKDTKSALMGHRCVSSGLVHNQHEQIVC